MSFSNRHRLSLFSLLIALFVLTCTSCQDDLLYDDTFIGEGEGDVSCAVSFIPLGTGLDTRTGGNAVKNIDNLCIVIYKSNGEYVNQYLLANNDECKKEYDYKYSETGNDQMPPDVPQTSPYSQAEAETPRASFKIKNLPYGRYRIYAVANLGNLSKDITATEETLKSYQVEWKTNVSLDNAMFGYFTTSEGQTSAGFTAPDLIVNKKTTSIHSWIKRTVSKVTIAFDPSGLKEAVSV